jgi:hypothetical protein
LFINATKQGKRMLWSLKTKVKSIERSHKRVIKCKNDGRLKQKGKMHNN